MFTLFSFTKRPAGSTYSRPVRADSCIGFIKWVTSFTKIKQSTRGRSVPLSHIFSMARSADAASIFCNISIFCAVYMTPFAHFFLFASFVVCLLYSSSPTAIFWLVIAIIINSVYLIAKRARPHIRNKIIKASKPPITNGDAPAAIILPTPVVGIVAAPLHARPDTIQRFSFFSVHGHHDKHKKQNCQYISLGDGYAF